MNAGESEIGSGTADRKRSWKQRVRRTFLLYVLVPYVVVTLAFALLQRFLMYRPTVAEDLSIAAIGEDSRFGEDVELETGDSCTLRGWLVKGRNTSEQTDPPPLVLYFPGNSLNRHERIDDLREVASSGFDVLIFDYRGFGDSSGAPSEQALSSDAMLIWRYATGPLGYDQSRIVVFGESLGGAVALSLWANTNDDLPRPAALVLNASFTSMQEIVAWHYPWFPFRFLLLDHWPSIERITRVEAPITVFHGTDDATVPVDHGRALANASDHARFIEVAGGSHNAIPVLRLRRELKSLFGER